MHEDKDRLVIFLHKIKQICAETVCNFNWGIWVQTTVTLRTHIRTWTRSNRGARYLCPPKSITLLSNAFQFSTRALHSFKFIKINSEFLLLWSQSIAFLCHWQFFSKIIAVLPTACSSSCVPDCGLSFPTAKSVIPFSPSSFPFLCWFCKEFRSRHQNLATLRLPQVYKQSNNPQIEVWQFLLMLYWPPPLNNCHLGTKEGKK
jgi:hypothetical protein